MLDIDDIYFEDELLSSQVKGYLKVSEREERMNQNFNFVAGTLGIREWRWGRLTVILFSFWTIMTCLVCFMKPDFLNLTLGVVGLFILLDPQQIK